MSAKMSAPVQQDSLGDVFAALLRAPMGIKKPVDLKIDWRALKQPQAICPKVM